MFGRIPTPRMTSKCLFDRPFSGGRGLAANPTRRGLLLRPGSLVFSGVDCFGDVTSVLTLRMASDQLLDHVGQLEKLESLRIKLATVSEPGMKSLERLVLPQATDTGSQSSHVGRVCTPGGVSRTWNT